MPKLRPLDLILPVLYEDDHLLAINKPAGLDTGGTAARTQTNVVALLAASRGRGETLHVANRLSRYESGVLVLGKGSAITDHIRTGLKSQRIAQEYVAVVLGKMRSESLVVDPTHGGSRGKKVVKKQGRDDRRPEPKRRPVAKGTPTSIRALHIGEKRTLVRCRTHVANTHALRAQLRAVRLRLLGDAVHDSSARKTNLSAICLHMSKIEFFHPNLKKKITISSKQPSCFKNVADGERDLDRRLLAALARRVTLMDEASTNAYRLLAGPAENVRALTADKFGDVVILQVADDGPTPLEAAKAAAKWYRQTLGVQAVYVKRFVKNRVGADEASLSDMKFERPLVGKAAPPEITIREQGMQFVIKPYDGFSVGLFLDHRDNRARVRRMAGDKEVLNLFAYTCGFSVAAAMGGATKTVSVDVAGRSLDWGKANFEKNGLDPDAHEFVTFDAFDFLKLAGKRGTLFDIVVIDPPSFAHGRKRGQSFSLEKDLPALVKAAGQVVRPGGVMMISTNYRRLTLARLKGLIKEGVGRRSTRVVETPPLPADFAMDPNHAKTIFMELG